jgi:hypothetical protein
MNDATLSVRFALLSLLARKKTLAIVVVIALVVLGITLRGRGVGSLGAADAALLGPYGRLGLPVSIFVLVRGWLGGDRPDRFAEPLSSWGIERRWSGPPIMTGMVLVAGAWGGLFALVTNVAARATFDLGDVATSTYVGILAGGAYAAVFLLGSTFFRRGLGAAFVFVADFVAGGSSSVVTAFLPRSHVRALLGGLPHGTWSDAASIATLYGIIVGCTLLASLRSQLRKTEF